MRRRGPKGQELLGWEGSTEGKRQSETHGLKADGGGVDVKIMTLLGHLGAENMDIADFMQKESTHE